MHEEIDIFYSYLITSSASLVSAMDNYNNMESIVYIICIASFLGHGYSDARGGRAANVFPGKEGRSGVYIVRIRVEQPRG